MRLKPRQSKAVRLRFAYPAMARGAYHLIVTLNTPGAVPETSESNNMASAGELWMS